MTGCPNCGALNTGPGFSCANCGHSLRPERTSGGLALFKRRHLFFILGVACAFVMFPVSLFMGYLFLHDLWWDKTCRRYGMILIWGTILLLTVTIIAAFF